MDIQIRNILEEDLDFCTTLAHSVGWISQDRSVFEIFLEKDPKGCFIAEIKGQRVGMVIATSYGKAGYLGTLIVDPGYRQQGIGGKLLMHGAQYLQSLGVESVYLDAAPKAVPLYERLGFVRISPITRFDGNITPKLHPQIHPLTPDDFREVFRLDRLAFGVDRSYFLEKRARLWPKACLVYKIGDEIAGFLTGRNFTGGVTIGPWVVSERVIDPICMLEALGVLSGETSLHLSLLDNNIPAVKLLRDAGFKERDDTHQRMVFGKMGNLGLSMMCYAIGALSKG